ncbi:MAG TPA: M64 family metallopeptidase [Bacteroidales bacterium]|nr:M64 family metallopeptidase [Bacteroidales bacterium]
MKSYSIKCLKFSVSLLLVSIAFQGYGQIDFNQYFTDETMRVDFIFAGDAESEYIYLDDIKKEPFWGGTKTQLISPLDYGEYTLEVFDLTSNKLIYKSGFCTLFEEWQTTNEAQKIDKGFQQTITFPYPKQAIQLKLYSRSWEGDFNEILSLDINPDNYFINPERQHFPFEKIVDHGTPDSKVDIAFLAEGYTQEEMDKFKKDVQRFVSYLFSQPPYDKEAENFNIWIVKSASEESGTDIPGKEIYKKTIMNSNFYTFDSERYLTTDNFFKVRDIASVVPYDDICIVVNSEKYGGGGIFNHYAIFTADHPSAEKVFIHEFGHSFAGLGDEYYTSSTSYNDFFNLEIEPWQPNLTTLKAFDKKWNHLIDEDTPIPTPRKREFNQTVGVFEGGGYVSKGMFSPVMDCRMKSNAAKGFCPVCQEAITKMIRTKSE